MQELYVGEHIEQDESGNTHTFQYYLLTDELRQDNFTCMDYGVMVRASAADQVRVPHITTDRTRIDSLLSLLQTHGASPIHLRDIIDDWL